MKPVDQAKEIQNRVHKALGAMQHLDYDDFTEDEVKFRFDAVVGVLIMASNELNKLVKEWEDVCHV